MNKSSSFEFILGDVLLANRPSEANTTACEDNNNEKESEKEAQWIMMMVIACVVSITDWLASSAVRLARWPTAELPGLIVKRANQLGYEWSCFSCYLAHSCRFGRFGRLEATNPRLWRTEPNLCDRWTRVWSSVISRRRRS